MRIRNARSLYEPTYRVSCQKRFHLELSRATSSYDRGDVRLCVLACALLVVSSRKVRNEDAISTMIVKPAP